MRKGSGLGKLCSVKGCGRKFLSKGLCSLHYERRRRKLAPKCNVGGCLNQSSHRGMCGKHYFRWSKYGNPLDGRVPNGKAQSFLQTFIDPCTDECIPWPFTLGENGYGNNVAGLGSPHVFTCEKFHGKKPTKKHEVAHSCGNRGCINPRHVRWAIHKDNEADKIIHGTTLHGERCGAAKLSNQQVLIIRSKFRKVSNIDLASQFGVSEATISVIGNRKTWKHI
jgi:HNH endonuclease